MILEVFAESSIVSTASKELLIPEIGRLLVPVSLSIDSVSLPSAERQISSIRSTICRIRTLLASQNQASVPQRDVRLFMNKTVAEIKEIYQIDFEIELSTHYLYLIGLSDQQLSEILYNLVDNFVKHNHGIKHPQMTVRLGYVHDTTNGQNTFTMTVTDNGHGFVVAGLRARITEHERGSQIDDEDKLNVNKLNDAEVIEYIIRHGISSQQDNAVHGRGWLKILEYVENGEGYDGVVHVRNAETGGAEIVIEITWRDGP